MCGNYPTIKKSEEMMITTWMRRIFALPSAARSGKCGKTPGRNTHNPQPSPGNNKPLNVRVRIALLVFALMIVYALFSAIFSGSGGETIPCPPPTAGQYPDCH